MTIQNMKQNSQWAFAVDLEDFQQQVIDASHQQPVLVDLWAEWCSPCLVIAPVLIQLVDEYAGALLLAKVEVDEGENMKLAGHYKVKGFPTVILFDQGEERGRFSSARPLGFIREFVAQHSLPP
jgi:putative thioredoxin